MFSKAVTSESKCGAQGTNFLQQVKVLKRLANAQFQRVGMHGLRDVVIGAQLHGFHRALDVPQKL